MDLNWQILDWINDLAGNSSLLDRAMEAAASYAIYAIVALAIASWFVRSGRRNEHRLALYAGGISAVISIAIALLIQHFYHEAKVLHGGDDCFEHRHSVDSIEYPTLRRAEFDLALL